MSEGDWKELDEAHTERVPSLTITVDVPKSLSRRLCELTSALGCRQSKYPHCVEAFEYRNSHRSYGIQDFRNYFMRSSYSNDAQKRCVQQLRYKIFLHLYRLLVKLETDEGKRKLYLTLCYELFDLEKPEKLCMQRNLRNRGKFIDRLTELSHKIALLNTREGLELKRLQTPFNRYFPIKLLKCAFQQAVVCVNCYMAGFLWPQEIYTINDVSELRNAENEGVHFDYGDLLEQQFRTNGKRNEQVIYIINYHVSQQHREYLERYALLMPYVTEGFREEYLDSPKSMLSSTNESRMSAVNIWESRDVILFLTDLIERICMHFEIMEIAAEECPLVATRGQQTEIPQCQRIDQLVQTELMANSDDALSAWSEQVLDETGNRIMIENLNLNEIIFSSSASVVLTASASKIGPKEKIVREIKIKTELDKGQETELEVDPGTKLEKEMETELYFELGTEHETTLYMELGTELGRQLGRELKMMDLGMELDMELVAEMRAKLESQLETTQRGLSIEQKRELGKQLGMASQTESETELEVASDQESMTDPNLDLKGRFSASTESEAEPDSKPATDRSSELESESATESEIETQPEPQQSGMEMLPALRRAPALYMLEPIPSLSTLQFPVDQWLHMRHVIAAPRDIIQAFKCNPAYRRSLLEPDAPDLFEQLAQFVETIALHGITNINLLRERLTDFIEWSIGMQGQSSEQCIAQLAKLPLSELLTRPEQDSFEIMRWHHRDRGDSCALTPQQRRQDALHAMLGYECQQLMPSGQSLRLLLRSPHHQQSLSHSYLLLAVSRVGYCYRSLQQQRDKLKTLGEQGAALVSCLMTELFMLHTFYEQQQAQEEHSLFHLYLHTRNFQLRFQWLLQLCEALTSRSSGQHLLWTLRRQLGTGGAACDELLQLWLLHATQPLLERMTKWLLTGELAQAEPQHFFIEERALATNQSFWKEQFVLHADRLPPFLSQSRAQQVLSIGRSQRYARQFLGIEPKCSLSAEQVQQQLSAACMEMYWEQQELLLEQLITSLQQEASSALFKQLPKQRPGPLKLLTKMHQYLLLSDADFVRQLIELLLPLLEQPAACYDVQQLNSFMEQLLSADNCQLYVAQSARESTHCWSRFLLRWQLAQHWSALLEHRMPQYDACFEALWQMHYVDYVLNERVQRQHSHFPERIDLNQSDDARRVRLRFEQFIERLQAFMRTLRSYMLQQVLGSAFDSLYVACKSRSLDELLGRHGEYLHSIQRGIFLTGQGRRPWQSLRKLYGIIVQLDGEQQRFVALCRLLVKYMNGGEQASGRMSKRFQEFRWSCQTTCDALDELNEQFQTGLVDFLLALHASGLEQWQQLAKKLDRTGFYASKFKQLNMVATFRFQRHKKKSIANV
ncbi:hypothetical protein KR222_000494 [Zaprionus bogoriensis]|nr:hypothetical protein KR222_000494 [Zaprionus bogoriensis]